MDLSNAIRNTYYKDSVFARDQQYYTQNLNGTRRQGERRESSLLKSRGNVGQQSFVNVNPPQQSLYNPQIIRQMQSKVQIGFPPSNQYQTNRATYAAKQQYSPQYLQTLQQNKQLKRKIDQALNGSNQFGNSSNVVMMQHYSKSQQETGIVKQQQQKIRRLQQNLKANQDKISLYKQAAEQLQLRMGNIQKIDKQLYKTLEGSVNRDKQLLERAASALARGQRREDIAKILQQILSH